MFYKLINERTLEKAPRPLKINGRDIFTTSESIHNEAGYYKLVRTEYPDSDGSYIPLYEKVGNEIITRWEKTEFNEEVSGDENN